MPERLSFGIARGRASQRGGSRLSMIITLAILAAMVFAAVKIVPVYFANFEFQDAINSESQFALTGYPKRSQDDIQDEVYKKAQQLGIPAKKDDIHVIMTSGTVSISLDYTVPIDLSVYQFNLQFHPHADNHSI
ncbi:MAG TPA: hypothetical protein VMB47_08970 [Candidatus Aquilonibacter sp.]|nr:hypothetical protein [Candidatus Aquilonibacter sp.]